MEKSIRRQRVELARVLRKPIADLSRQLAPFWENRYRLESLLARSTLTCATCLSRQGFSDNLLNDARSKAIRQSEDWYFSNPA
ncbi:hypothetical protein [Thiohalophilus sp.]|uniref:hypothetical protein n=1 Tax=Thiohalophilus sp. TaxID=3028392 RepID=UPI002ACD9B1F|nr:hypothetical protein [Thiohalophilus sp.]MDZ7661116.1 hypothetical protein [Thiohalophilus sp.]MDZ7803227.1 hypothetical protein [Thiohalophilus sp.]